MLISLSLITCFILIYSLVETHYGINRITKLETVIPEIDLTAKLSIIITACNEETQIAKTLKNLQNQSYLSLEIICVNDRSNDKTGSIIGNIAKNDHRIKLVHICKLPEGWLGKNYASFRGKEEATGDWLLFLDADVQLGSQTISRAMTYVKNKELDHLTVLGHYRCKGFIYNIANLVYQGHGLLIPLQPWKAKSTRSKKSINLGLFCLIKKAVYEDCGGHKSAPLECLDDLHLGKRIKQKRYKQEAVSAQEDVALAWYPNLRKHREGYQKNAFAYFKYRWSPLILGILAWYSFFVWPIFACITTSGFCFLINCFNSLLLLVLYLKVADFFKVNKLYALFFPIGLIIYPYLIISSAITFYINKGIFWRGTFYPADTLRKAYINSPYSVKTNPNSPVKNNHVK